MSSDQPGQREPHEWHRREAPDTSVAFAYRQASSGDHLTVFDLFVQHRELTCREVAAMMEKPMHSVSGRLTFLARDGVIEDTGKRRGGGRVMRIRPESAWRSPDDAPTQQPLDYRSEEARTVQAQRENEKRDALVRWLLDNKEKGREMWAKWTARGKLKKPREWLDDMRRRIGEEKSRRRNAAGK